MTNKFINIKKGVGLFEPKYKSLKRVDDSKLKSCYTAQRRKAVTQMFRRHFSLKFVSVQLFQPFYTLVMISTKTKEKQRFMMFTSTFHGWILNYSTYLYFNIIKSSLLYCCSEFNKTTRV